MKLSQVDTQVLTTLFGEEVVTKLSGALPTEDGELSLGLRINGKVLTEDQQKEIRENGIKQGKELGYKEVAKSLEITLDAGEKDPEKIAEKLKTSISSVLEEKYKNPNPTKEQIELAKKVAEAEEKYKTLLNTHKTKEIELEEWKGKYEQKEKAIKEESLNNKILSVLPKDITMDKGDALLIIKNSLNFEDNDGKTVISKGDKKYFDPLGEPETLENVIPLFAEEKGWIKKEGGMGGGNRGGEGGGVGHKGLTPEQAHKYLKEKGIAATSPEGLKVFNEITAK
jgi:hypothetical protein